MRIIHLTSAALVLSATSALEIPFMAAPAHASPVVTRAYGHSQARPEQGKGRAGSEQAQGQAQTRQGAGRAEKQQGQGRPGSQQGRERARPQQGQGRAGSPQGQERARPQQGEVRPGNQQGQGRSDAQGQGRPGAPGQARATMRAQGRSGAARGGRVDPRQLRQAVQRLQPEVRRFATSTRPDQRMVAGAAARAMIRGLAPAALVVTSSDDGVRVRNRQNQLLLDLDQRSAGDLGAWEMRRLGDQRPREGSPAFCRSGEGHPVWGREWCLDKGFGLGGDGVLWSRGTVDDVVFGRRDERDRLDRGSLADVLGSIVFGRLALHALTLGYDQPLVGTWVDEPQGPRLLRVHSGDRPVAELLDSDRDDQVEVLYVVQPI